MKTLRYTSITLGLLAVSLLLTGTASQAQSLLPGVKIEKATTNLQDLDHPGIVKVLDEPSVFKDGFDKSWIGNKAKIDQIMCDTIAASNKNGLFPKGYTLYHQKSSVATVGTLRTQLVGSSDLLLTYVVPNNYLEFTTTVPANIFGAGLDPRFSLTYDLTLKISIPLSSVLTGLQITSAVAAISNVSRPDTHNFTADQAGTISAIVQVFGGRDFLGLFQKSIDGAQFPVTQQLQQIMGQVNTPLQGLSKQGYTLLSAQPDPQTHALLLRASVPDTTLRVSVDRLNDMANVSPAERRLIRTFAKVQFFDSVVAGQTRGTATVFTRSLPADVRSVPIHIEVQRDVPVTARGASGGPAKIDPNGPPSGVIRSIDLTYDRTTGHFSGAVSGQTGAEIGVLSDRIQGVTFFVKIDDSGPRPPAGRIITWPERPQLPTRP